MTDLPAKVSTARRRLAQIETVEDATDLVDDLEQLRKYGQIVDAAPEQINDITLIKVETRAKRADLVDAGQDAGRYRRQGNQPKVGTRQPLPVRKEDVAVDRVLRADLDSIRTVIAKSSTVEVVERQLIESARRRRRQETDRAARVIETADPDGSTGDRWALLRGDMRERLGDLDPHSIDLIVTDPPYPREFAELWTALAEHASRLLVPGGVLVALSGKIHLDDIMARLGQHLAYGWVYVEQLTGSSTRIMARRIAQEWKPWLAYTNGAWPNGLVDWHGDLLAAAPKSKSRYAWEQAEGPAGELIGILSPTNGVVLDPFMGTGTYGIAALNAGRRFIGIEADVGRAAQAAERLREVAA